MNTKICYQYDHEHGNGYWDKKKNCVLGLLLLKTGLGSNLKGTVLCVSNVLRLSKTAPIRVKLLILKSIL